MKHGQHSTSIIVNPVPAAQFVQTIQARSSLTSPISLTYSEASKLVWISVMLIVMASSQKFFSSVFLQRTLFRCLQLHQHWDSQAYILRFVLSLMWNWRVQFSIRNFVSPNPATNKLTIENGNGHYSVEIFDVLISSVFIKKVRNPKSEAGVIDVSNSFRILIRNLPIKNFSSKFVVSQIIFCWKFHCH